jgi:hypothetical protein
LAFGPSSAPGRVLCAACLGSRVDPRACCSRPRGVPTIGHVRGVRQLGVRVLIRLVALRSRAQVVP